jgi:hypothetical protein
MEEFPHPCPLPMREGGAKRRVREVCPGCAKSIPSPGHLCHPEPRMEPCPDCGKPALAQHMCPQKLRKAEFVCLRCGRLSEKDGLLCAPLTIFSNRI